MYAKIFTQIFDSSIAENYEVRHVFEDLLKLADKDGVVDMTTEAISRRTNVPLEKVRFGIEQLSQPDKSSRSKEQDGRRLIPLDSRRNWGWIIVNYGHYRALQDEETRKKYFRDAKRKQREKKARRAKGPGARERQYEKILGDEGPEAADSMLHESAPDYRANGEGEGAATANE